MFSFDYTTILNKILLVDPLNYQAKVTKLRFLCRLRSIALILQILCIFPGLHYHYLSFENLSKYIGVIALSCFFNIVTTWKLRTEKTQTDYYIFVHLLVDLGGLTLLLYFSGGWNNPFMPLYFFHACLGALVLPGVMSMMFFLVLALCMYLCFAYTCNPGFRYWLISLPREIIFLSELFIAFIIWLLSFWLAFILKQLQSNIDRLNQRHSRFERLRAVGAFAAGFSHQLASPLNNIKLRTERFRRKHPGLSEDNDLNSLMNSVEQCDRVFKNFFAEQILESDDLLKPTPMSAFLEQVVHAWQHDNPHVLVRVSNLDTEKLTMPIPQLAMARTLMDLLDNARNAQVGLHRAIIEVSWGGIEQDLFIQIKDFGKGVPPNIIERLGEPFLSEGRGGTGLGLFTAIGLIQSLGGVLKIQNIKSGGAMVQILLPVEHGEQYPPRGKEERA